MALTRLSWSIKYDDVSNNYSDQLHDYYRDAVTLRPDPASNSKDPHKCVWDGRRFKCIMELTKTLDAEVICQLQLLTLTVKPVNEFDPEFSATLSSVSIPELARRNTVITDLKGQVHDKDCFLGGGVQNVKLENGTDWVRLNGTKVVLNKEIQRFEEVVQSGQTRLWFQLSAKDSGGRVGKGMLIVGVKDVDNRPPYFSSLGCEWLQPQNCSHAFYTANVTDAFTGDVDIRPAQIRAEDGDIMLNDTIRYSFRGDRYTDFVQIDGQTGTVRVVANLTDYTNSTITLTVVATEDTKEQHHSAATLLMNVIPRLKGDYSSPVASKVLAFTLSAGFITVIGAAVALCLNHRRKRGRPEEARQQGQEGESRPMGDLQAQPDLKPVSTEEISAVTSSQPSEVNESSADPVTFESVSEVTISENQPE
ncbi:protocadherin Fat 1-like [Babylonia areolata]|uniref:protocadherin Fat 1-like n=1 Tax=Babylonia areolata TaxID=304850 RepID=UPI003FD101EB